MIGQIISHYKILEKLGEGGMGVVYKAEDTKLRRFVALKFLPSEFTKDPEAKHRFIREARAASALDHPNICTIYEISETENGQLCIAMGYYEGGTLKQQLRDGPLSTEAAVDYTLQIAEALDHAHKHEIVHRDIKPANIFITTDGVVKLLDFGLAKFINEAQLTKTGTTLGTIAYMSPEQIKGDSVDRRTDIWSLGVIFYEMITGNRPFRGDNDQVLIFNILNTQYSTAIQKQPENQSYLEPFIYKILNKNPDHRYHDMKELTHDLHAIKKGIHPVLRFREQIELHWNRYRQRYATLFAFLSLCLLVGYFFIQPPRNNIRSLAILPLEDLSDQPIQAYMLEGLHQELTNTLGQISGLQVSSRRSTMLYRDTELSIPEIARELGVDMIADPTVIIDNDQLRCTIPLIDGKTDRLIWSMSRQFEMRDFLVFASDAATDIARELEVVLTSDEKNLLARTAPVNSEVYDAYLRGQHFLNQMTGIGMSKAEAAFQEAISIDSTFSQAYVGLAEVNWYYGWGYVAKPIPEVISNARNALQKALRFNENNAEAHALMGDFHADFNWDWDAAMDEYQTALFLNPNSADVHWAYAIFLSLFERFDEALHEMQMAVQLDPLTPDRILGVGWAYYWRQEFDHAKAKFQEVIDLYPNFAMAHYNLGMVYMQVGRYQEAVDALRKSVALAPEDVHQQSLLTRAYVLGGYRPQADSLLSILEIRAEAEYISHFFQALIHMTLDDKEKALDHLEISLTNKEPWLTNLKREYFNWKPLHDEPRFQAIMAEMNFPS